MIKFILKNHLIPTLCGDEGTRENNAQTSIASNKHINNQPSVILQPMRDLPETKTADISFVDQQLLPFQSSVAGLKLQT